jgi:glycosyltransferase involved in cell wall biosynthesis
MRIAIFTETFLPKVDGIVNTLCHLLEHLALRGHSAIVFAPEGGPDEYAGSAVIGFPAIPFPIYPELRFVSPTIDVKEELNAFRPDLIHILNPVSLGLAGLRYGKSHDIPVVASYHTDVPGFATRWGWQFLAEPLWGYFRWLHNQADLNLCPSRITQAELQEHGFQRVQVWGRGVDSALFHPAKRSLDWRNRLTNGNPDQPLLLYVGRVSVEKRIEWVRPVLDALPHVRFAVVGDGPNRPLLEELFAGTNTVFTGYLGGEELAAAYAAADIFAFPSPNETLGNVVLEAMASGLPVVTPRAGGVLDHVEHGVTGLLVDPEVNQDFINAIKLLVETPSYARKLGQTGRSRVEGRTWAFVLDKLLREYDSLIATVPYKIAA